MIFIYLQECDFPLTWSISIEYLHIAFDQYTPDQILKPIQNILRQDLYPTRRKEKERRSGFVIEIAVVQY